MFGYYDHHMDGGDWFGMALMMLLFWGLLAVVLLVGFRWLAGDRGRSTGAPTATPSGTPSGTGSAPRPTPAELLAERFARGEIDETEYAARMRALRDHSS